MINMMGIQGIQINTTCQEGGAVGKGLKEIKFSDLLQALRGTGKKQNQGKEAFVAGGSSWDDLPDRINDLLADTLPDKLPDSLFNALPALAGREFDLPASSEKQLLTAEQLTAVLEELSGILDGVENKEFANGNEIGEHLLFLISTADRSVSAQGDTLQALLALLGESSTSIEVKAAVMRILGQDGSVSTGTANIQQAGQLSTVESPSGATTAAQGSELIDALKSVSTDEALSKEADGASLRGSVGQVKAETGERANLASISDGTAASGDEVSLNKKPVPSALEFQLKASAEQQNQKGVQAQGVLVQQENKQSEVKSSTGFLPDEGLNAGSVPLQTGSSQQVFSISSRAAPVMENAVLEQVMQAIESSSLITDKNMHMLSISLKPEYLGELKLMITLEHGIVNAHFLVQNQMTANLIESQLSDLKQSLSQQGVSWQEVTVSVDTGSASAQSEQGAEQGMNQQWEGSGGFAGGEDDFSEPHSYKGWGMVNYVV
ncbi:MAG: flagellar hook-length control protein FliK [Syntrophaceticus sp.]|jgi:flagellar hook-length control protein FliK